MRAVLLRRLLLFAGFSLLSAFVVSGQITNVTGEQAPPTPGAGHDYIKMLNETVNPGSGSVSIRITVPVPPGRGVTVPFSIGYDSNAAVHMGQNWTDNLSLLGHAGWSYAMPQLTYAVGTLQGPPYPPPPPVCLYYLDYVMTDLASGSHALQISSLQPAGVGLCDGRTYNPAANEYVVNQLTGADARVQAVTSVPNSQSAPPVTVADTDGLTYFFPAGGDVLNVPPGNSSGAPAGSNGNVVFALPSKIEDRNGNYANILDQGNGAFTITDTAGRTALSSSGFGATGNTITVSGLANPYQLTWITPAATTLSSSLLYICYPSGSGACPTNGTQSTPYNSRNVVTQIQLPNSKSYQFQYDPATSLLSKLIYPTGGYVRYVWQQSPSYWDARYWIGPCPNNSSQCAQLQHTLWIEMKYQAYLLKQRFVSFDGVHEVLEQDFAYTVSWSTPDPTYGTDHWTQKTTTVTTHDLVRGTNFNTVYTYSAFPVPIQPNDVIPPLATAGENTPVETQIQYCDTSGNLLHTVQKTYVDPHLPPDQTITLGSGQACNAAPSGQTSKTHNVYTSSGTACSGSVCTLAQLTDTYEYDYGPSAPGPLMKQTHINYASFAATPIFPSRPSILDRPSNIITYDGNSNRLAETDYTYDQTQSCSGHSTCAVSPAPTAHDETNYAASSTAPRGNATTTTKQCFQGTQACASGNLAMTWIFDETGQVISTTDPNNHTTQFSYADSYTVLSGGANVPYTPTSNTNTYLTRITNPLSQSQNFTYDFNNGQLTVAKDPNNLTTTYLYNDPLARPTLTTRPDNGTTTAAYNDAALTVTTSKKINPSQTLTSVALSDGVGHVKQTQVTSDPQGAVYIDNAFDGLGRIYTVSNPYRTGGDPTTSSGTTTYFYDTLGRKCLEVPPDGTLPTGGVCPTTQPANTVFTTYSGNTTTVTDQTGKSRKSIVDGLGRVTQVFEDPAGVNYETDYAYDALGNLLCSGQKGTNSGTFTNCASIPAGWRGRNFSYDSLSRLLTAYNPETTTITYKYDSDSSCASPFTFLGLVVSKTDARGIRTCAQYDVINRETVLNYSNGDPTITTAYDGSNCLGLSACQNIGQRTSMTDAAGSESWAYQVDAANNRNIHVNQRTTSSIAKTSTYYLDLASNLTQVVYPTGRVVNYTYDNANRPKTASDGSNGITYATDFQTAPTGCLTGAVCYTPQGTLYALSIGQAAGFTGLNLTHTYNNRLQPNEFKASSTGGNAIDITYNFVDPVTSHNAGHVYGISNNLDSTRSQTFTYDTINRTTSALTTSTHATSPSHCWGESYTVDAWGNLNSIAATTNPSYTGCSQESGFSSTADGNNHLPAWAYDASGNATSDGFVTNYQWDAESQLKSAAGVTYTYDGDSRRVSKVGSKLYWYGTGGDILAETNSSGAVTAEYIFFGGKRIAMIPAGGNPTYYVEDLLGTSRVLTTNAGVVCFDADFYPYGGERAYTNTCQQNYKFEGKERDSETGNDDFGARYYSNRFGRWLSTDWSSVPAPVPYASLTNPQTLNLYAMVADDPESFADLDGHNYFYVDGHYEWHDGSDYTWTDKKGNEHSLHSDYNFLITIQKTGQKTKDGAEVVRITLKGPGDKELAHSTGFSGGYVDGIHYNPTTKGRYEINLNKQGGPDTNVIIGKTLDDMQLGAWHDGLQRIASDVPGFPGYSFQGEWGTMRANLTPLDGQSHMFYLHGKNIPRTSTHGCTCDSGEAVLQKIFSLGPASVGEGSKRGIIAVSVQ